MNSYKFLSRPQSFCTNFLDCNPLVVSVSWFFVTHPPLPRVFMTRNFSHKARIASQHFRKMQTALPRVPPRPFKPFARLADPLDDGNIDYLADKFHSISMDGALLSLPTDTTHITAPGPTPVYDQNGSTSGHSGADLLFTGNGSAESPFIEVPQEATSSTGRNQREDYRLWEQEIYPLPEIISEHNPLFSEPRAGRIYTSWPRSTASNSISISNWPQRSRIGTRARALSYLRFVGGTVTTVHIRVTAPIVVLWGLSIAPTAFSSTVSIATTSSTNGTQGTWPPRNTSTRSSLRSSNKRPGGPASFSHDLISIYAYMRLRLH